MKDVLFALDNVNKTTWRFSVAAMSHELAHNMEYVNPHIRKRCVEFLNYRTANRPPVSLNRLWLSSPHIKEEQKKYILMDRTKGMKQQSQMIFLIRIAEKHIQME